MTDVQAGPPKIPLVSRLSISLETAFLMFLCSAVVAFFKTHQMPHVDSLAYAVSLGAPAVAWLLFVVLACIFPAVIAPGRLSFPLNITLPLVFTALTYLIYGLLMRTGSSLTAPPDRLLPATIWGQPAPLITALIGQILTLSIFLKLSQIAQRPSTAE